MHYIQLHLRSHTEKADNTLKTTLSSHRLPRPPCPPGEVLRYLKQHNAEPPAPLRLNSDRCPSTPPWGEPPKPTLITHRLQVS